MPPSKYAQSYLEYNSNSSKNSLSKHFMSSTYDKKNSKKRLKVNFYDRKERARHYVNCQSKYRYQNFSLFGFGFSATTSNATGTIEGLVNISAFAGGSGPVMERRHTKGQKVYPQSVQLRGIIGLQPVFGSKMDIASLCLVYRKAFNLAATAETFDRSECWDYTGSTGSIALPNPDFSDTYEILWEKRWTLIGDWVDTLDPQTDRTHADIDEFIRIPDHVWIKFPEANNNGLQGIGQLWLVGRGQFSPNQTNADFQCKVNYYDPA